MYIQTVMILEPGASAPAPAFLGTTDRRRGVWADGSCLFHAIVAGKAGGTLQPKATGLALRSSIARRATPERYLASWKAYGHKDLPILPFPDFVRKLEEGFSDMYTIPYIMWDQNLNILFAEDDGFYCGVDYFHPGRRNLLVYWAKGEHFEPIGGTRAPTKSVRALYGMCSLGFYEKFLINFSTPGR
ncbi:MAG: hypothetical protein CMD33_03615 [Flavobacteriales bacterium]|nr:hypothetical protein [Flavobacteriales bacterium]